MNPYIEKLKTYLTEPSCNETEDAPSLLELLFNCYREHTPGDTQEIAADFARLNAVLSKLTLQECDQVWDLTCRLCSEHEQAAFFEGFRVAILLAAELWKDWE